jgi:hypothetical protein
VPRRWELSRTELPRVGRSVLGLVEYLGWSPGHIHWQREQVLERARARHHASMRVLQTLESQYRT